MKKLFELKEFPWILISTRGSMLKIVFQDKPSSYVKWCEVVIRYDAKHKEFLLKEIKP